MVPTSVHDHAAQRGRAVRMDARNGVLTTPTAGLAAGNVQANLAILPAALAADFLLFCQRNPRACPLLSVSEPGNPALPELGRDIDIRTDLPRYRVWRHGELVQEPTDVREVWRDDLVSFLIGCSFSFEEALLAEGIEVRHIACGSNAPMWRCNIPTRPAGPFAGPLVVSMRPFKPADAIRAIQLTSRFPSVHGAPVHIGDPALIGIQSLQRPDYGEAVPVHEGETPVFWACGVTPQSVIATARPEFCITHAPGHMLVTDLLNSRLAVF
ncbi:putative hydro-lyase [Bordetella petrii]|nr:putative hydro-lyase [Bordetella petrii]